MMMDVKRSSLVKFASKQAPYLDGEAVLGSSHLTCIPLRVELKPYIVGLHMPNIVPGFCAVSARHAPQKPLHPRKDLDGAQDAGTLPTGSPHKADTRAGVYKYVVC